MGFPARFWILVCIETLCLKAAAQPSGILFSHYTTEEGLSNNTVWSICKDKAGFTWLGTQDGLNRFDGKDFRVFRNSPIDTNSISSNTVYHVMADDEGMLWAGTYNGLNRFDTRLDKLTRISFAARANGGKTDPLIGAIAENKTDHTIWVGGNGLFKVNKKNNSLEPAPGKLNDIYFSDLGGSIRSIFIESQEQIWLGSNKGFFLFHPATGDFENFHTPPKKNLPGMYDYFIAAIHKAGNGNLWLATYGAGIMEFDPIQKKFLGFYLPEKENDGFKGGKNIVYDIAQTDFTGEKNILWITSNNPSLTAFDIQSHSFKDFTGLTPADKKGVFGSGYSLCFDKQDGLWIGGKKGCYLYDKRLQVFKENVFGRPVVNGCLNNLRSVCVNTADATGNSIWVGTYTCGLFKYNLSTGIYSEIPEHFKRQLPSAITTMYQDKGGNLWISNIPGGLYSYNEKKGEVKQYNFPTVNKTGNGHPWINNFFEDPEGQLWMGTRDGTYYFDAQRKEIKKIEWEIPENLKAMTTANTEGICADPSGNIWFSVSLDYDRYLPAIGIIKKGSNKAILYYFNASAVPAIKNIKVISGITCTKNSRLFCASWSGLITWNSNEHPPDFKLIPEEAGLLNNYINTIEKDKNDNIWVGTLSGLCRYNPQSASFKTYANSGLETDAVSELFMNPQNGLLHVGDWESSRMYSINTTDTAYTIPSPSVFITGIRIFDKAWPVAAGTALNNAVVELPYSKNVITISYTAPVFFNTAFVRYAYKIDELDKDWIYTNEKSITYNLKDGNYHFHVKAMNAEGKWIDEGTGISISIKVPFWKNPWFIAGLLLLTAGVIYWLFQLRLRRVRQLFTLRNNIAKDLHDEIGSTLTSIKILSEVSYNNMLKDPGKASSLLEKITEQSAQMQQGMSDIVWAISASNDTLQNMVVRMREYVSYTLEPKNIQAAFTISEQVLEKNLNMEQRRDIFLVFKEAINNAAKYSQCTKVMIGISKNNGGIRMLITDNGVGFDTTKTTSSNGLKNMKSRAEALNGRLFIESSPGKGTKIQLDIITT